MKDDASLLRSYAAEGSQEAFAELVRRHLALVYHAALRQTGGDGHRAEEAAQLVFADLARKAAALSRRPLLVSWLHTSTRYAANNLRRAELRRRTREQEAYAMNGADLAPDPAADWQRLRPVIDDALQSLGERDRAAVLLRFFENRSYAELGVQLSLSEEAARARVNRALEKLRAALAHRGLVSTASALGLALAQPAFAGVPAGLASHVTAASLAATSAASVGVVGAAAGAASFLGAAKLATGVVGAAALLTVGVVLHRAPPAPADPSPSASPALSSADIDAILRPARLAPADADAALAAYLALPPFNDPVSAADFAQRSARLRALLVVLPTASFERLLAALATRAGEAEGRLRRVAFNVWVERDPAASSRWAAALVPSPTLDARTRWDCLSTAVVAWSELDFDSAYAWAAALPDSRQALRLAGGLLGQLATTDPARSLALAQAGDAEFQAAVRHAIFQGWAKTDPRAAVNALGSVLLAEAKRGRNQDWEFRRTMGEWARRDLAPALAWVGAQSSAEPAEVATLLRSFVDGAKGNSQSTRAILELIHAHPELPHHNDLLYRSVNQWCRDDASAALAWLQTLPNAEQRANLIENSFLNGAGAAIDDALLLAGALPAGPTRDKLIAGSIVRWAEREPDAALAWLQARHDPAFAPVAVQVQTAMIARLATSDPDAALARWNALPAGPEKQNTALVLADKWSSKDPGAATQWLAAQAVPEAVATDTSSPVDTTALVLPRWISRDPVAAAAWVSALPASPLRDKAVAAFSRPYSNWFEPQPNPVRADLLAGIQNPALRDQMLTTHLRGWMRLDVRAATTWIESNDALSPEAAARLLAR